MKVCLIAYDNDSYIHYFPLGIAYVASKLRQQGHEVVVYPQDKYHYPESHLTAYLRRSDFDVVGVGMCAGYYQYAKLKKIAQAVKEAEVPLWIGGHLVSPEPEYFKQLTGAEKVCVGEYDYEERVDKISYPSWDLFDIDYYALIRLPHAENSDRCFPVLSGRGCPFHCTFCYRMYNGYRARSTANIIDEIETLMDAYRINYIDFADELLMTSPERAVEISKALKPLNIKWMCNGRLNYAKPSVLKEMKESGCQFINYGIESVDDEVLKQMNKKLTYKQIVDGVEATLSAGISPGLNMLFGNIGDDRETLRKAVDFLITYDDQAQLRTIRPVTPYPGCDLYKKAIEMGKLVDVKDFYENKHKNSDLMTVNFTDLDDELFYVSLNNANTRLAQNYYKKTLYRTLDTMDRLYGDRDATFRGFRQT